jgi:hypothetical protein
VEDMHQPKFRYLFIIVFPLAILYYSKSTAPDNQPPVNPGMVEITYQLAQVTGPVPTYQTVIWLEDADSQFVKSLFVSGWLAYGGYAYQRYTICPSWNSKADWQNISAEEFDVATGATPIIGQNSFNFGFKENNLKSGKYICNIETHISENYNIRYSGEIIVKSDIFSVVPIPYFIPEQHPQAGDVLYDVKMKYYFNNNK